MSRIEDLKSLKVSNADAAFATSFGTLVGGGFLVGFIQLLGGNEMWVNVLSAIPSIAGVLQLPGAIWGRRFPTFKRFVFGGGMLWRLLYLPLVFLPVLAFSNDARLLIVTLCVALASISVMVVNPTMNDWLAELIPANSRGFFFARRSAICTIVGALAGIFGAILLDAYKAKGQAPVGFSLVFGIGLVSSAISMYFFLRMRDIPRPNPVKEQFWQGIKSIAHPFKDREYRKVLWFLGMAALGQTFAGNLFASFGLKTIDLNYKILQGTGVMHALGMLVFLKPWGFIADRFGNKPVVAITGIMVAMNPLPWVLCSPGHGLGNAAILLGTHPLMALGWSGMGLCQFNLMLATAKEDDRASYIGAGMALMALVGGIAPLFGAKMFEILQSSYSDEISYKTVFVATAIIRLISVFFIFPVNEIGSRGVKQVINDLRQVSPKGYRALRTLNKGDIQSREAAIEEVGEERMQLAFDAVSKALHDPQPRVRRRAASAIARLDDKRGVDELIHQLEYHPDLVEEETIFALRDIGDPRAIPWLVRSFQSPRSLLRRASARALGEIIARHSYEHPGVTSDEQQQAIDALVTAASDPLDPDLRRGAIRALQDIRYEPAAPVISEALLDPWPSVRIAAAEAVAELGLSGALPYLRRSLDEHEDEASAEVAYALGAIGTAEDVPRIIAQANTSPSIITRRRCLLGVARNMGVEELVYRLMLLDDMERDTALMELIPSRRGKKTTLRTALEMFSAGRETEAVALLEAEDPRLSPLVKQPVPEAALIAFALLADRP